MNSDEKQYIHTLFETDNFSELYQVQAEVINEMLSINYQQDFEDFLINEDYIDEDVYGLFATA